MARMRHIFTEYPAGMCRKEVGMTINSILGVGGDTSSLFGSSDIFGNSSSSSTSGGFSLADYASIKNGSYGKLTKAYYAKKKTEEAGGEDKKETVSAEKKTAASASSLRAAASALKDNKSLFEKVTKKNADGEETTDYDWDNIGKKVQNFVDAFNEAYAAGSKSEASGSYRGALSMVQKSAANKNLLSSVGISIGEDGKLSLNTDKLKEANINDLKTLFSGSGSFADSIDSSASQIVTNSSDMARKLYGSNGSYSGNIGGGAALDTIV